MADLSNSNKVLIFHHVMTCPPDRQGRVRTCVFLRKSAVQTGAKRYKTVHSLFRGSEPKQRPGRNTRGSLRRSIAGRIPAQNGHQCTTSRPSPAGGIRTCLAIMAGNSRGLKGYAGRPLLSIAADRSPCLAPRRTLASKVGQVTMPPLGSNTASGHYPRLQPLDAGADVVHH